MPHSISCEERVEAHTHILFSKEQRENYAVVEALLIRRMFIVAKELFVLVYQLAHFFF